MSNSEMSKVKLENLLAFHEKRLPEVLEDIRYNRKGVRKGIALRSVVQYEYARGIYAFFIEDNIEKCKQCFYSASRLTLASVGLDGGASFEVGTDLQIALLSDSPEVIDLISNVQTSALIAARDNPRTSEF